MNDLKVQCINKQPRNNVYEGITHLGGDGWWSPRQHVIEWLRQAGNTLYTLVNNKRTNVGIVDGPNGPYLQTYADGQWNNNLLSLPECPTR